MILRLLVIATCAVLLVAAGCANARPDAAAPAAASSAGAFPVTVEHRYGTTVIDAEPKRVVSVGLTEQDVLLQLGVVPIAVTEWYGEQSYATWPWAKALLGDAKPTVLKATDSFEFEKVAQLAPDLIIGTNSGMSKADYDKFSKIAPTVPGAKDSPDYFSAWDIQTTLIAKALGQEAKGAELVAQTKKAFADAAAAHPEFAGKTATFSQGGPYEDILYVYPDGMNTEFLTMLGFTITPGLEKHRPRPGEQAQISPELVDLIDADVIVFATESKAGFDELQKWATIRTLGAVKEDRSVYTDGTLAGAIYFMTPLSLAYVLENLTPKLALAAEGRAPRSFPS